MKNINIPTWLKGGIIAIIAYTVFAIITGITGPLFFMTGGGMSFFGVISYFLSPLLYKLPLLFKCDGGLLCFLLVTYLIGILFYFILGSVIGLIYSFLNRRIKQKIDYNRIYLSENNLFMKVIIIISILLIYAGRGNYYKQDIININFSIINYFNLLTPNSLILIYSLLLIIPLFASDKFSRRLLIFTAILIPIIVIGVIVEHTFYLSYGEGIATIFLLPIVMFFLLILTHFIMMYLSTINKKIAISILTIIFVISILSFVLLGIYGQINELNKQLNSCDDYNYPNRVRCFTWKAIQWNKEKICDDYRLNQTEREDCKIIYDTYITAISSKNADLCDSILLKDVCYYDLALKLKDITLCDKLEYETHNLYSKEECRKNCC